MIHTIRKVTAASALLLLVISAIGQQKITAHKVDTVTQRPPIGYSTAGFYTIDGTPRSVSSLNPAWRFAKGSYPDASKSDFDDSNWEAVSLPHGLELLPVDASGGVNYRGESWYRKHFTIDADQQGRRQMLYFEAIMGKSEVWVNGHSVNKHYGGFLPLAVDITDYLNYGGENIISVKADNSDDADFPPGKPQATLDYCYFGGIYRDVWLVSSGKTYITDPNQVGRTAGGGLLVSQRAVSEQQATLGLQLDIANDLPTSAKGHVEYTLIAPDGAVAATKRAPFNLRADSNAVVSTDIDIKKPALWSPETPSLYALQVRLLDSRGRVLDGYRQMIGVRSIEFNPKYGLVLNGKPYPRKLIGANRHQDFAVIGNALSNSLHYRDVLKLKEAGMEVIRNAHYPQDPAFMDACNQLGMFVIVNTPGWQFWNDKPIFGERVYDDVRQMVRRDRNHPSVLMWEPILNETWYPENFAADVHNIVKQEYPYSPNYTASDSEAKGAEIFDIQFAHPRVGDAEFSASHIDTSKCYFTREWGDNVDDWNSHNSSSRVARDWGEVPQIIQAQHYAQPDYPFTSYDALYRAPASHFGGTLWHSFDHQRGYHPDPFYGGVMDAFRRPKYSYYMFQAQATYADPMVFIANELSPFSPEDVTVYSNCDTVLLHTFVGDTLRRYTKVKGAEGLPSPLITFPKAWNFMADKALSRGGRQGEAFLLAEGIKDGKVVATHRRAMSRRPVKLLLEIDNQGVPTTADGSDLVTVVASIADASGQIKRLNNQSVIFEVEGPARLLTPDASSSIPLEWGEAAVLLQSTLTPGKVKIRARLAAEGDNTALPAEIEFETLAPNTPLLYNADQAAEISQTNATQRAAGGVGVSDAKRAEIEAQLRAVEAQQEAFGEKSK